MKKSKSDIVYEQAMAQYSRNPQCLIEEGILANAYEKLKGMLSEILEKSDDKILSFIKENPIIKALKAKYKFVEQAAKDAYEKTVTEKDGKRILDLDGLKAYYENFKSRVQTESRLTSGLNIINEHLWWQDMSNEEEEEYARREREREIDAQNERYSDINAVSAVLFVLLFAFITFAGGSFVSSVVAPGIGVLTVSTLLKWFFA